jgi:hypothetical protein
MGNICKGLFEALKMNHIATFRYPQANGMVERSFRVVGECFRRMPEDKRHAWPRELPRISFALNVTAHASLGDLSPFEVEHGRSCRLPFDSQFVEVAPADAERKVPGVYGQLAAASALYRKVAAEAALAARTAGNAALNARGAPGRCVKFKLGDIVVIYLPPAAEKKGEGDTLAARWKAKHLLQWRGPCVVSEVLGGSTYKVREEASGKYFTRGVALMLCTAAMSLRLWFRLLWRSWPARRSLLAPFLPWSTSLVRQASGSCNSRKSSSAMGC